MSVELVMRIVADERDGDHYLSHLIFVRKVLRESWATAIRFAQAFAHRPLTRSDCEALIADWQEEGWLPDA